MLKLHNGLALNRQKNQDRNSSAEMMRARDSISILTEVTKSHAMCLNSFGRNRRNSNSIYACGIGTALESYFKL